MTALAAAAAVTPLTAQLLLLRELAAADLQPSLAALPDPSLLCDLDRAATRLADAIDRGERIAVHGDYDVDGITGAALLTAGLRALGAATEYHIPLRMIDGYGLSAEALRKARANGCTVAVSVDCGISARAEALLARELGLDLIVTDHHQAPAELPAALAVIDPHRPDDAFPDKSLAGVGVAFFLLIGLRRLLRARGWFSSRPEPDLRQLLDLVALGTIADVAPLTGINRLLVTLGLQRLEQGGRVGLDALRRVAGVTEVSAAAVGFRLAPRLNAAGRLEDAALGVRLLLSESRQEADAIAAELDQINRERQEIENSTLQQVLSRLESLPDSPAIVLAGDGWHPGVIGIVAGRVAERFHRPTLLIALDGDSGKGSARSVSGFDLYQGLHECRDLLQAFGGHRAAAGLSLCRTAVPALARALAAAVRRQLGEVPPLPVTEYDAEVTLAQLTPAQVRELSRLAPHGPGNPSVLLRVNGCELRDTRTLTGGHLRFRIGTGAGALGCIGFGLAVRLPGLRGPCDLLCVPEFDRWNGQERLQLKVRDLRSSA